jgi:hypothetical protein
MYRKVIAEIVSEIGPQIKVLKIGKIYGNV